MDNPKNLNPAVSLRGVASRRENDLTLNAAALQLEFVTEAEFDRIVDPGKMVRLYVGK